MNAGKNKIIIGVTGTIGAGKTEACNQLKKAGYYVVNVDEFAHFLYKKGSKLWNILKNEYGHNIMDTKGEINRGVLAGIVFKDNKSYMFFSSIIFPFLNEKLRNHIKKLKKKIIILDMAVLFESGFYKNVDYIILIKTKYPQWIKRIKYRHDITKVKKIRSFQGMFSMPKKIALSDVVIYNNCSINELGESIRKNVLNLLGRDQ